MALRICSQLKDDKNYNTDISCDDDAGITCCFQNRIFTYSERSNELRCDERWPRCTVTTATAVKSSLSQYELIWVIVACCLLFIALMVIFCLIYRLLKLKREKEVQPLPVKTPQPSNTSSVMVISVAERGEEKSMGARPATKQGEGARPVTKQGDGGLEGETGYGPNMPTILLTSNLRGNSPEALRYKLKELIAQKDEEKLAAMVETIENFYQGQLSEAELDEARGVLEIWQLEKDLVRVVSSAEVGSEQCDIAQIEALLKQIEGSEHKAHIAEKRLIDARHLVTSVTNKDALVKDLKQSVLHAIQASNSEVLEALVDTIRAKQLDKECEAELILAQNMFEKSCNDGMLSKVVVETELSKAIELRKSAGLRRAIMRAEESDYSTDLSKELEKARKVVVELEEIEKSRNMQRLRISSAMKSNNTNKMEQCIQETKFSGFGEELRKELEGLEISLKRKYLQKRLKGNLNVAVTSLDLVKLRRAVNEASAAGFLKELGLELNQAQGLITKLERLELIKKAVLQLSNSHIAEIKSYTAPPVEVHRVLMSLLIVLGEEPDTVRDWFEIQVMLIKTGKLSLKRRVEEFQPQDLSMTSAKRAAKLLAGISHENLQNISKAAKVFYLWTSAVVEDRLSNDTIIYQAADAFKSGTANSV